METDFHWAETAAPRKSQGSRRIKTQWARGESGMQTELGARVATSGQPGLLRGLGLCTKDTGGPAVTHTEIYDRKEPRRQAPCARGASLRAPSVSM